MTKIQIRDFVSPFAVLLKNPDLVKLEKQKEARDLIRLQGVMHVSPSGCWSYTYDKGYINSYERFGYHSGAEYLLEAYLLLGGKVQFHNFRGISGSVTLDTLEDQEADLGEFWRTVDHIEAQGGDVMQWIRSHKVKAP